MTEQEWFLSGDDGPAGPYTAEQLAGWLADDTITADWYVWREGFDEWKPIRAVDELIPNISPSAPATAIPSDSKTTATTATWTVDGPEAAGLKPVRRFRIPIFPIVVILLLGTAGWGIFQIVDEPASPAWPVCITYADALLFFDYGGAMTASSDEAYRRAREDRTNTYMEEQTIKIAGRVTGRWRTPIEVIESDKGATVRFFESVQRSPESSSEVRTGHFLVTCTADDSIGSWKVNAFRREQVEEFGIRHRIREGIRFQEVEG